MKDFIECEGGRWIPRERIEYVLQKSKTADKVKTMSGEFLDTYDFVPDQTAPTIAVCALMDDGEMIPVVLRTSSVSGAVLVNDSTSAFMCDGRLFFVPANLYEAEKALRSEVGGAAWEFDGEFDLGACRLFKDLWVASK